MDETNNFVTILIKAPNQRITDQIVQCQPNWSVRELKNHLAVVYPNKPHPDVQKLIYSGSLMPDGAILSEILKTYDGQQNNTIHLVCSPSKEVLAPQEKIKPISLSGHNEEGQLQTPLVRDDAELRRRISHMSLPNSINIQNFEGITQEQMYQQMMWMQQAYMHYISQCMMMVGNNGMNPIPRDREQNIQAENADNQNRGAEEEVEEDGQFHRDWLDWVYMFSRIVVLFSFVYFYSSPLRCAMVVTMALLFYHLGMLRWRPVQNNNNNNNNVNNNRQGAEEVVPEENIADDHLQAQPVTQIHYPNWLNIAWTFLSSFFLSLIPEQREV